MQLSYLAEEIDVANQVIRASDLLSVLSAQVTLNTGGPPLLGATIQDDGFGSFVWSSFATAGFTYMRPGGVDGYRRPGGIDTYLRP